MKGLNEAIGYLKKYTKDFVILDKSQVLGGGTSNEVDLQLDNGEVVASVNHVGNVLVFWGSGWFQMNGEKCAILSNHSHLGSEMLLISKWDTGESAEVLVRSAGRCVHGY